MIAFPRTVSAAVSYLAKHPELHADPAQLMLACAEWTAVAILKLQEDSALIQITPAIIADAMHQAGLCAVKEVAMPCKQIVTENLINPEDLQ